MTERIRLYSQDYTQVLYTTDDRDAAKQYFRDSGHDWLPIVFDIGHREKREPCWQYRWSGRIGRLAGGGTETVGGWEFLNHHRTQP